VKEDEDLFSEAEQLLLHLTKHFPNNAQYHLLFGRVHEERAYALQNQGKYKEAYESGRRSAESYLASLKLKPRNPDARNHLCNGKRCMSQAIAASGNLDQAATIMEEVIKNRQGLVEEFPNVPLFEKEFGNDYNLLAHVLRDDAPKSIGNRRLAARHLFAAYRANPNDLHTIGFLTVTYIKWDSACAALGDMSGRILFEKEAVEEASEFVLHVFDRVEAVYKQRSDPFVAVLVNNLAYLANNLAWKIVSRSEAVSVGPPLAIRLARAAVKLAPDDPGSRNTLGVALYRGGEFQEAIEHLNESYSPGAGHDAHNLFWLAMAHYQLGKEEQAREYLDRAIKWTQDHDPGNGELLRFQAEAEELIGAPQATPEISR
jgi:tetratricopeptide (TPR) repeat protein